MDRSRPPPAFVIPHYARDARRLTYLRRAVESILTQSSSDYRLVIVDDASPFPDIDAALADIRRLDSRIEVLRHACNIGPGGARNTGVRRAAALKAPFVMFHDDDDVANQHRVKLTKALFTRHAEIDFIYSDFIAVDENGCPIPPAETRLDMLEVLEQLGRGPVVGPDAWISIATDTGFLATTSTVAVRTDLAVAVPFPPFRVSEDSHTWLRMSASGAHFAYAPEIPAQYRITRGADPSCKGRDRVFLAEKAHNDIEGFVEAAALASSRGVALPLATDDLIRRFLHRLAACLERQGYTAEYLRSSRLAASIESRLAALTAAPRKLSAYAARRMLGTAQGHRSDRVGGANPSWALSAARCLEDVAD
jgi:hypothetical protein